MLNINLLSPRVLRDIRDSFGMQYKGPEDIASLTKQEALDRFLRYHGIIGYTDDIIEAMGCLAQAEETPKHHRSFTALQRHQIITLLWDYLKPESGSIKRTGFGVKTQEGLLAALEGIAYEEE